VHFLNAREPNALARDCRFLRCHRLEGDRRGVGEDPAPARPHLPDLAVHAPSFLRPVVRDVELVAAEPRLRATAIQTVGSKGWDGFAVAFVTEI